MQCYWFPADGSCNRQQAYYSIHHRNCLPTASTPAAGFWVSVCPDLPLTLTGTIHCCFTHLRLRPQCFLNVFLLQRRTSGSWYEIKDCGKDEASTRNWRRLWYVLQWTQLHVDTAVIVLYEFRRALMLAQASGDQNSACMPFVLG